MRASVSRSPQFATPLIPHIGLGRFPPHSLHLQLINLGFDVEKLNPLKPAVDQAGNAIQKSKAKNVLVKEEQNRRPGQPEERLSQPSTPLRLRSEKRGRQISGAPLSFKPDARVPVRLLIVLLNVVRKRLHVVMDQGMLQLTDPVARLSDHMFVDFHIGHRIILLRQPALKTRFAAPE